MDLGKMDEVNGNYSNLGTITFEQWVSFSIILILFYDVEQANDSGLAAYVAGQIDRSLSWKVYQMIPNG